MRNLKVALAQSAPRLGKVEENLDAHLRAIDRARELGADVVLFPELSLTGYHLLDQVPEVAVAPDEPAIERLAAAADGIDVVVGFVERSSDYRYYNAAAYLSSGSCLHVHRKLYLPTYGMFQEGRDFAAGDRLRAFDTPWGRAGILICEDLWHPATTFLLAHQGIDVVLALSNSPTRGARPERGVTSVHVWRELMQVNAQFQTCFFAYANRVGCEDGLVFGGGSMAVDPFGRVVGALPPLEPGMIVVELEADVLRRARTAYPLLRDERLDLVRRELDRLMAERYDVALAEDEA